MYTLYAYSTTHVHVRCTYHIYLDSGHPRIIAGGSACAKKHTRAALEKLSWLIMIFILLRQRGTCRYTLVYEVWDPGTGNITNDVI